MVTSCDTGPGAWRHQEEIIRAHFPRHDSSVILTEDPADADVILVGNIRSENNWGNLRSCQLVRRFPAKSFVIHDGDEIPRYCQGIQTSLTRSPWNLGRFRSGSYFLFHPDFKNPHIERWFTEGRLSSTPPPSKQYLASFSGRNCLPLRERLLTLKWQRDDVLIRDTTRSFDNFTHQPLGKGPAQEAYFNVAIRSKFILCPRGNGAASIRFFEAMQLGVAPVLISDNWVLPEGPDWDKCMLRIPERELGRLEEILLRHEADAATLGAAAQQAYAKHFHGEAYVRFLVDAARSIQRQRTFIPERCFRLLWGPSIFAQKVRRRLRRMFPEPGPAPAAVA
jgi:Exostosin family